MVESESVFIKESINRLFIKSEKIDCSFTQIQTVKILEKVRNIKSISRIVKNSKGMIAACIYIALLMKGIKRSQKEIAYVIGVSTVTMKIRYKEIIDKLGLAKQPEGRID